MSNRILDIEVKLSERQFATLLDTFLGAPDSPAGASPNETVLKLGEFSVELAPAGVDPHTYSSLRSPGTSPNLPRTHRVIEVAAA